MMCEAINDNNAETCNKCGSTYCAKRLVVRAHKVDSVRWWCWCWWIIIDFCHMGNRGGTWPSVYCVFEHLIFMDLKVFKKKLTNEH